MRITAGAHTWKKIKGVMENRRISCKPKENVLSSCVLPAHLNALETMALTEKQDEKAQVCENIMAGRIVGVNRADKKNG